MYQEISRILTFVVSVAITYGLYDQSWKLWRTRSGKDFTPSIVLALVLNELAWLNYGCSIAEWPIILVGILNVPAVIWLAAGYIRAVGGQRISLRARPISRTPGIYTLNVVDDCADVDEIWGLYERVFEPVNRQTPIMQSFAETEFRGFLANPAVTKILAIGEEGRVVGVALITTDLSHEPLLSPSFFEEHYQGRKLYYVLTIAIDPQNRDMQLAKGMLSDLIDVCDPSGACFLMNSEGVNRAIPRLAQWARPEIVGRQLDKEAVWEFTMTGKDLEG